MGGLGCFQFFDYQMYMFLYFCYFDFVGGYGFVEVFDGDFLKCQLVFQFCKVCF